MNEKQMRIISLKQLKAEIELKIEKMMNEELVDMKILKEEEDSLENLKKKIKRMQDEALKGQLII